MKIDGDIAYEVSESCDEELEHMEKAIVLQSSQ